MKLKSYFQILIIVVFLFFELFNCDDPNRLPTKCEICKYLTTEIGESLIKHNSHEYIETAYNIDERLNRKNAKKYRDSEIRLIEVIEEVCDRILDYNVHAERPGSLRYSKGESQTMGTLKGLVNRGVKVELGIPYDLWDTPSAEITQLRKYCDSMVEKYEEEIQDWFMTERDKVSLTDFLCERIILKSDEKVCLQEIFTGKEDVENEKENKKDKPKEIEEKEKPNTNDDKKDEYDKKEDL